MAASQVPAYSAKMPPSHRPSLLTDFPPGAVSEVVRSGPVPRALPMRSVRRFHRQPGRLPVSGSHLHLPAPSHKNGRHSPTLLAPPDPASLWLETPPSSVHQILP